MIKLKIGTWLICGSLIFWIVYNSYFGWNAYALSESEKVCDHIYRWVSIVGYVIYLMPLLDLYAINVKKHL